MTAWNTHSKSSGASSSPAGNEFTVDDVVYTFRRRVGVGAIGAFIMVVSLAMPDLDPNRIQRVDDDHVKFTPGVPV